MTYGKISQIELTFRRRMWYKIINKGVASAVCVASQHLGRKVWLALIRQTYAKPEAVHGSRPLETKGTPSMVSIPYLVFFRFYGGLHTGMFFGEVSESRKQEILNVID